MTLKLRKDIWYVGPVKRRKRKAFLAKMVERCPDMYECRFVDDEKAVVELVRFLNRKCVAILRVELSHIYIMKLVLMDKTSTRPNLLSQIVISSFQLLPCSAET